jgi:hypothetical protein
MKIKYWLPLALLLTLALISPLFFGCASVLEETTTTTSASGTTTTTAAGGTTTTSTSHSTTTTNPWTVTNVAPIGSYAGFYNAGFTSLAIDSAGKPHIGYIYWNNSFATIIKYATLTGGSWTTEVVDPVLGVGGGCLKLDAGGNPCIVYNGPSAPAGTYPWGDIRFTVRSGGTWTINIVDHDTAPTYGYTSNSKTPFAFDSLGNSYIANTTNNDDLRLAVGSVGSGWTNPVVLHDHSLGDAALALDPSGNPHISYYDGGTLVKYSGSNGGPTVGSGEQSAIAVDSAGYPHVVYNGIGGYLIYAKWNGSAWESQVLNNYITTSGVSIVLDTSNRPHIAYCHNGLYDGANYVHWTGTTWEYETVEPNIAPSDISIALDPVSGKPRISYQDSSAKMLCYGARN